MKGQFKNKQKTNRVVILGAGQIGTHIMQRLAEDGYDVLLIDQNDDALKKASFLADIATANGNGTNPRLYETIGLNEKDLFIGVTDSDETNLVACQITKAFGCSLKVARVRQPFYISDQNSRTSPQFWQEMGVEILFNQSLLASQEIEHLLETPGALDSISFNKGAIKINTYRVKKKSLFCGRRLSGFGDVPAFKNLTVAAVSTSKGGELDTPITIIPRGNYSMCEGDLLFISGKQGDLGFSKVGKILDPDLRDTFRKVFILGDNVFSHFLAEQLVNKYPKKSINLIERTKKDAYLASERLNNKINTLLIDIHDIQNLKNEGLDQEAIFIGASKNEDDNLLACLVAKEECNSRTIALIQSTIYSKMIPYLNLDSIVSPKLLLVDQVLKSLSHQFYDVLSARDHNAEILEFVVTQNTLVEGQTLQDSQIPKNSIIVGIFREDKLIIPKGDTILCSGDYVIIFALKSAIRKLQHIFWGN